MGYITNAVGLRLNLNERGWSDKIVDSNSNHFFLFYVKKYLTDLVFSRKFQNRGFIFSHATIKLFTDRVEIILFLYDGRLEERISYLKTLLKRPLKKLQRPYLGRLKYLKWQYGRRMPWFLHKRLKKDEHKGLRYIKLMTSIARIRRSYFISQLRYLIFVRLRLYSLRWRLRHLQFRLESVFGLKHVYLKVLPVGGEAKLDVATMARYIVRKLYHKYRLMEIINPLIKGVSRFFTGLRIDCAGRFTRAQRASFSSLQVGRVPLNSFRYPIEYAHATIPLKYGMCSIKVWICYKTRKMQLFSVNKSRNESWRKLLLKRSKI